MSSNEPRSLSNLRAETEAEHEAAEEESRELLQEVKNQARNMAVGLAKANSEPIKELRANQLDIQQAQQGVAKEISQFDENQRQWSESIGALHKSLLKFGDLETFFESATDRLETLVRRLETLKVNETSV